MQGPEEDFRESVIDFCEEQARQQWEEDGGEGPMLTRDEIDEFI